jgi:sugar O-acyltransferase (sialic acid O-acetyltransferase NeuD family)
MSERLIILGLGAQTKYVLETFTLTGQYQPTGIMVLDSASPISEQLGQVPILGWDEDRLKVYRHEGIHRAMVVHSNNRKKSEFMIKIMDLGFELVNAIHPRACIATNVQIGYNVIINAHAVIQPFAQVGNGVMVHAGVILEHDNIIADCVNLAPGATLAGWVQVQEGAYIYTNATVIPARKIGKHAIIGAGAVVLEDVPDYAVVVGNPARITKYLSNTPL